MWLSDYCLGALGCILLRNALCLHKKRSRGPSFLPSVALNRPTISYSPKYFQYLIESLFPSHFNFSFLDHYNTFYIITLYNHEQSIALCFLWCNPYVYLVSSNWQMLEHIPTLPGAYLWSLSGLLHCSALMQINYLYVISLEFLGRHSLFKKKKKSFFIAQNWIQMVLEYLQ